MAENDILASLVLRTHIVDSAGTQVFSTEDDIQALYPVLASHVDNTWNTERINPGEYRVVSELNDPKAVIEATLEAEGKVCATCRGTFVAVTEGHPAFHRW